MVSFRETSNIGKGRRLQRLFPCGKCVLVPLDDSFISGPVGGLRDLEAKVAQIESAGPSALMALSGTLSLTKSYNIPIILNLTASSVIGQHTNKVLVSSVERAISLGAEAVAVHVNFSSKYESEMLRNVEKVKGRCDKYGLPLMILAYPRSESSNELKDINKDNNYLDLKLNQNDEYTKLVSHCVRMAFELGADIIKAQYTGDSTSFEQVVKSACGVPVLIAGGKPENRTKLFTMVEGAMSVGASGVSIGRYIFNDEHSDVLVDVIKKLVYDHISSEQAMACYESVVKNRSL